MRPLSSGRSGPNMNGLPPNPRRNAHRSHDSLGTGPARSHPPLRHRYDGIEDLTATAELHLPDEAPRARCGTMDAVFASVRGAPFGRRRSSSVPRASSESDLRASPPAPRPATLARALRAIGGSWKNLLLCELCFTKRLTSLI